MDNQLIEMKPKAVGGSESWQNRRRWFRNERRDNLKRFRKSQEVMEVSPDLNVMSFNCNGLSGKVDELADWLEEREVDVAFISKVKLRAGTQFTRFNIEGYKDHEELRLEDQGSMVTYISTSVGMYTSKWDGLVEGSQDWMKSE